MSGLPPLYPHGSDLPITPNPASPSSSRNGGGSSGTSNPFAQFGSHGYPPVPPFSERSESSSSQTPAPSEIRTRTTRRSSSKRRKQSSVTLDFSNNPSVSNTPSNKPNLVKMLDEYRCESCKSKNIDCQTYVDGKTHSACLQCTESDNLTLCEYRPFENTPRDHNIFALPSLIDTPRGRLRTSEVLDFENMKLGITTPSLPDLSEMFTPQTLHSSNPNSTTRNRTSMLTSGAIQSRSRRSTSRMMRASSIASIASVTSALNPSLLGRKRQSKTIQDGRTRSNPSPRILRREKDNISYPRSKPKQNYEDKKHLSTNERFIQSNPENIHFDKYSQASQMNTDTSLTHENAPNLGNFLLGKKPDELQSSSSNQNPDSYQPPMQKDHNFNTGFMTETTYPYAEQSSYPIPQYVQWANNNDQSVSNQQNPIPTQQTLLQPRRKSARRISPSEIDERASKKLYQGHDSGESSSIADLGEEGWLFVPEEDAQNRSASEQAVIPSVETGPLKFDQTTNEGPMDSANGPPIIGSSTKEDGRGLFESITIPHDSDDAMSVKSESATPLIRVKPTTKVNQTSQQQLPDELIQRTAAITNARDNRRGVVFDSGTDFGNAEPPGPTETNPYVQNETVEENAHQGDTNGSSPKFSMFYPPLNLDLVSNTQESRARNATIIAERARLVWMSENVKNPIHLCHSSMDGQINPDGNGAGGPSKSNAAPAHNASVNRQVGVPTQGRSNDTTPQRMTRSRLAKQKEDALEKQREERTKRATNKGKGKEKVTDTNTERWGDWEENRGPAGTIPNAVASNIGVTDIMANYDDNESDVDYQFEEDDDDNDTVLAGEVEEDDDLGPFNTDATTTEQVNSTVTNLTYPGSREVPEDPNQEFGREREYHQELSKPWKGKEKVGDRLEKRMLFEPSFHHPETTTQQSVTQTRLPSPGIGPSRGMMAPPPLPRPKKKTKKATASYVKIGSINQREPKRMNDMSNTNSKTTDTVNNWLINQVDNNNERSLANNQMKGIIAPRPTTSRQQGMITNNIQDQSTSAPTARMYATPQVEDESRVIPQNDIRASEAISASMVVSPDSSTSRPDTNYDNPLLSSSATMSTPTSIPVSGKESRRSVSLKSFSEEEISTLVEFVETVGPLLPKSQSDNELEMLGRRTLLKLWRRCENILGMEPSVGKGGEPESGSR